MAKNGVNEITIIGHIGNLNGVQLKEFGNNKCAITISVATTDSYKTAADGWKEQTQWHDVIFWGNQARWAAKEIAQGREIYVKGTLKYRNYVKTVGSGEQVTMTKAEIDCKNAKFFGEKQMTQGSPARTKSSPSATKPSATEKQKKENDEFPDNIESNTIN